jgi:hypothetical protein
LKKRHQFDVLSICLAVGFIYCLAFSVRSVRYVGGQYLPTHNGEFALLAALLALSFVLVRVRVRKLMRSESLGFPVLPRKDP